jgi:hypothetical protein
MFYLQDLFNKSKLKHGTMGSIGRGLHKSTKWNNLKGLLK